MGGQNVFFVFVFFLLSTLVSVPPLFILTDTSFDAFHWLFFTVVQCSQGVLCNVHRTPKIISISKLKINKENTKPFYHLIVLVFQIHLATGNHLDFHFLHNSGNLEFNVWWINSLWSIAVIFNGRYQTNILV